MNQEKKEKKYGKNPFIPEQNAENLENILNASATITINEIVIDASNHTEILQNNYSDFINDSIELFKKIKEVNTLYYKFKIKHLSFDNQKVGDLFNELEEGLILTLNSMNNTICFIPPTCIIDDYSDEI